MDFKIPDEVLYILNTINQKGFEAFLVGGCVRDTLLKRIPKDWDITTNATPEKVKAFFDKTIDTGIKHGTVSVLLNNQPFEITTYRVDGHYLDSRRPSSVSFTSSLKEDLGRRDFTINALAYHPSKGLIDFFNGKNDIDKGVIRAVGNACDRFSEDALRMLRAVRFSAQLDFNIDPETLEAIKIKGQLIQRISMERIRDELTKILTSDNPLKFVLLKDTSLLGYILPEFDICFDTPQNTPYHIYNVAVHSLNSAAYIECNRILRWTMLLHDIGKPKTRTTDKNGTDHFYFHQRLSKNISESVLKRLKFDNRSANYILRLVEFHDNNPGDSHESVRKALSIIGSDIFPDLLKVKEADLRAQNPDFFNAGYEKLQRLKSIYLDIMEKQQCISLDSLAVNGNDLINLGFVPGKEIGLLLQRLLDEVIERPELNTKDRLIDLLKNIN